MTGPNAKVVRLAEDGATLSLPKELAEKAGLKEGTELFALSPGGLLLFAKEAGKNHFVGSLETLSIAEVFGFICSAIRSGTLTLQSGLRQRRIGFCEGQVVSATSSETAERLGPVLWRYGLLSLEQLAECEPKVKGGVRLGKVLVDSGVLSPGQLYRGMQLQVKEIVLAAFLETAGEFAFVEGDCAEMNTVKPGERTRDLVLQGMSRAERMAALDNLFDRDAVPTRKKGAAAPAERDRATVFGRVDGARSVREIIAVGRLGEFGALQALKALVDAGLVEVAKKPKAAEVETKVEPGAGPGATYAEAIRRVSSAMKAAGKLSRLNSFFGALEGPQQGLFEGLSISEEGELDVDRVLANAQKVQKGPMGRALALDALDTFVSFALFDARNVLPAAKAAELSRDISRLLRG